MVSIAWVWCTSHECSVPHLNMFPSPEWYPWLKCSVSNLSGIPYLIVHKYVVSLMWLGCPLPSPECGVPHLSVVSFTWALGFSPECDVFHLSVVSTWVWCPSIESGVLQLSVVSFIWMWCPSPECGIPHLSVVSFTWMWCPSPECGVLHLNVVSFTWIWCP